MRLSKELHPMNTTKSVHQSDVQGTLEAAMFSVYFFSRLPIPGGGAAVST